MVGFWNITLVGESTHVVGAMGAGMWERWSCDVSVCCCCCSFCVWRWLICVVYFQYNVVDDLSKIDRHIRLMVLVSEPHGGVIFSFLSRLIKNKHTLFMRLTRRWALCWVFIFCGVLWVLLRSIIIVGVILCINCAEKKENETKQRPEIHVIKSVVLVAFVILWTEFKGERMYNVIWWLREVVVCAIRVCFVSFCEFFDELFFVATNFCSFIAICCALKGRKTWWGTPSDNYGFLPC